MKWLAGCVFAWVVFVGPWHESWIEVLDGSNHEAVTRQRLGQLPKRPPTKNTPLEVGVATRDITEEAKGLPLAGYGGRVFRSHTGIRDAIQVKALAIKTGTNRLVFVTGDLLLINQKLVDAVMAELAARGSAYERRELYFGATHTHSGPGGFPGRTLECLGLGWFHERFFSALVGALADVIQAAETNTVPALMKHWDVEVPRECLSNRTRTGGSVNRHLDLIAFQVAESRRWQASLVVFSAHATCMPSQDERLSSDYPGELTRQIEQQFGGPCLFFAGGVGSMAPGEIAPKSELATALANRLLEAIKKKQESDPGNHGQSVTEIHSHDFVLALPAPQIKLTNHWRLSPLVAGLFMPTETHLQVVRLGPLVFLGTPTDFNGSLAAELRTAVVDSTTIVTSFAGDYIGYVIDDEDYDLNRYEPRQMVFFGRHLGKYFQTTLKSLAQSLK